MERNKKNQYTQEFKNHAIELAKEFQSSTRARKKLGMSESNIRKWIQQREQDDELKALSPGGSMEEFQRLRKENAELKKVNFIVKAAAAVFCQGQFK